MNPPSPSGPGIGNSFSPGGRIGGGRYLLKRLLGRGQSSEVWLAQDVKDSKTVALKFFPAAFLSDANLIERLKQDAQRFFLLKHPHIVTTYDFIRDPGAVAIASEYVDGWSLASMKVDKLCGCHTVAEIESWIHQLCDALAFAHNDLGIVHADLKPANLLVNAQEELKVTDFEVANLARQECSKRGLSKGLYAGLGFLSPQQVMGEPVTKLDDIYSLGATIFDLLTGTPPFYRGEIFAQICSLKAPTMTARIAELDIQDDPVPPVWEDAVARCLAKNPADRPQSVSEVLELLKRPALPKSITLVAVPPGIAALATKDAPLVEAPAAAAPPAPVPEIPPVLSAEATDRAQPAPPAEILPVTLPPQIVSTPVLAPAASARTPVILFAVVILLLVAIAGAAVLLARHAGSATASNPVTHAAPTAVAATASGPSSAKPGSPGSLDKSFNTGDGADDAIHAITVQPDGKILLGGKFATFNGASHHDIVRLNPDGSVDATFTHDTVGIVQSIVVQPDGRIFIAGDSMLKGHPRSRILRLNGDGSVDKSFKYGLKINFDVRSIVLQPDGHLVAGGSFTLLGANKQERLLRLGPDATPDADFDANVSAPATICALALQPDGKIIAAGVFKAFHGAPAGHIIRLNPDGTPDPHFSAGSGTDGNIFAVAVQPDGGILIAGNFTAVNGRSFPHLARLNPDGTVDTSFNVGAGTEKSVQGIALQPDGKILIGGDFTTFQNQPCPHVARLNPDGSLDTTFNPGYGTAGNVGVVALQPDGKVLLGGDFTAFDGSNCGRIARLNNPSIAK
jgi:uncharacterized delta-60 repeat protein